MNALLTLAARTLVEHCAGRPPDEQAAACDAALHFLAQQELSPSALRGFLIAVRRELTMHPKIIPALLTTSTGHAGAAKASILSALEKTMDATVDLTEHHDPTILGGALLAVGDDRLNTSLRGALLQLQNHLAI